MAIHTPSADTQEILDVPEFMRTEPAADRPKLSIVKSAAEPIEGAVVEHQGDVERPAWLQSNRALRHALDNHLYVGWSVRGYRQLGRRWLEARHDDHPQMIETARLALRGAKGDLERETELRDVVDYRRAVYKRHKRILALKTGGWTTAATVGGIVGVATGGLWVDLAMTLGAFVAGTWHGRPEPTGQEPAAPALDANEPDESSVPTYDAPPPPALSEESLKAALRANRIDDSITMLAAPSWDAKRTATTVFDCAPGVTIKSIRDKAAGIAGALGRDLSMIDINKEGAEGRISLWMTDRHPFADSRPSPLLTHRGGLDTWNNGVPVAWSKRGTPVVLPITNSNFLIGGMTRSGKGVGAANLVSGAALDHRINLRIVAGKNNGEWDAYARHGIAATYFKPDPDRLLALLKAELADKNRREAELGKLGKSKLVPGAIDKLGGIEVIAIDELATYTRPGKRLRDEILEALIELSAVAAGAGILVVLITQYPEADVIPQALAMNCDTRWAMRVDNATQSNAILGGGASGSGRDASKFDPPIPGLGWLVNPFAGVTDLARSFDLDEDERGEISKLMQRAADLRNSAGRLVGQWKDPIEQYLLNETGLSSASGGPGRDGQPGREALHLTDAQVQQKEATRGALAAMDELGRDAAQLDEMAEIIGGSMTADRLGELFRAAGP